MKNLLKKILSKIKVLYNYIRIELNLNLNIPYHFLLKKPLAKKDKYIEIYNKIKNIEYSPNTSLPRNNSGNNAPTNFNAELKVPNTYEFFSVNF